MASVFKVKDSSTGLFWDGSRTGTKQTSFNARGHTWKTFKSAQTHIARMGPLNNRHNFLSKYNQGFTVPDVMNLEIVEYEVTLSEKNHATNVRGVYDALMANELNENEGYYEFSKDDYYWEMVRRNAADKIDFIFEMRLNSTKKASIYIRTARQNELAQVKQTCKLALSQMKINSRNYREHRNMFGFLDPKLAMNARLLLTDVVVTDLRPIRAKVLAMMNLTSIP